MKPPVVPALRLAVCLLIAATSTAAQEFWDKKDYREWTEKECRRILEDSPWTKRYVVQRAVLQELGTRTLDRGRESAPSVEYHVQLRSAAPVRRAMVRLQMLGMKYDKLKPEEQRAFDQQAEKFLNAPMGDRVVIFVAFSTNVPAFVADLSNYWRSQSTEVIKQNIKLFPPRGDNLPPVNFIPGQDGFQLIFPRESAREPILTANDKEMRLEFVSPQISGVAGDLGSASAARTGVPTERILVAFKVKEMNFAGKLAY